MTNASEALPAAARQRMGPVLVVTLLALLLGTQPITTDLYLPALPGLAADLDSPMGSTQLTLSALLFAFGLGQLLLGPAADRFGRQRAARGQPRPVRAPPGPGSSAAARPDGSSS